MELTPGIFLPGQRRMGLLLSFFFCIFLLLFEYSCLHFPPTTPPHLSHPHFLPLILPPFGFVHVSLYMFLKMLLPFPPL